ncbi:MAG TPA: LacI family transcriptional regulator [Clostridia bacterium]|nr:LacI family transcriptional regulator [Clostridia bacterium]
MDIREIAKKAGVSISTVSRAINQPHLVNKKTRGKILAIVKESGYVPNPFARGLLTGKTSTIALVVPTLKNPIFGETAEGAESYLSFHGYSLITYSSLASMERYQTIVDNIRSRKVDGIILAGSGIFQRGYQEPLEDINVPIVAIEYLPGNTTMSCIYVDDITGVKMALEHLIFLNHRRIALIAGNPGMIVTKRRLEAAYKTLEFYNIDIKEEYLVSGLYAHMESGYTAMEKLLAVDPLPTAVFAFNDMLAIGAIKCIKDKGLSVPHDISIIGFDNIPTGGYISPGLTTINQPCLDIAEKAAKMLLEQIAKPATSVRKILLPCELIIRGSTSENRKKQVS